MADAPCDLFEIALHLPARPDVEARRQERFIQHHLATWQHLLDPGDGKTGMVTQILFPLQLDRNIQYAGHDGLFPRGETGIIGKRDLRVYETGRGCALFEVYRRNPRLAQRHGQIDQPLFDINGDVDNGWEGTRVGQIEWRAIGKDAPAMGQAELPETKIIPVERQGSESPGKPHRLSTGELGQPFQITGLLLKMLRVKEQSFRP
uniref:Uncharacterized protein n=1 Tax=Candidatus Kentrum sp. DK TaxID=2126562 RepID=A0A450TDR2_9GAMM|nr:MAG: hypothetical protein BECKDK2373C_GA0170839_11262 [Candidatus Kentron sp. DK]